MRFFSGVSGVMVLLGASLGAFGQGAAPTTVLVEPPTPLLAQSIGSYAADVITRSNEDTIRATLASPESFNAATCLPALPGGARPPHVESQAAVGCTAAFREDGLTRLAVGSYRHQSAGQPVEISVLEFGDATGAYSAYTLLRALEGPSARLRVTAGDAKSGQAHETTTDADGALVWAGTVVLRVKGQLPAKEMGALIAMQPKVGGRRGLAPLLPTYLPAKGILAGTERYALGPVSYKAMGGMLPADLLAWDKSAEVATAEYAGRGGGKGAVTLMLYPTPQIAGDRGRALEKYVNEAGVAQFGSLKMRRVGPLLGMTTGALGAEQATEFIAGLHLNQDLSFDKPMPLEFHAEVKKTATLLQSIAAFCGIGVIAALVLGTFLGGARAGIRVLQGKPAASDPEFLTINLRSDKKGLFAPKEEAGGGKVGEVR